MLSLFSWLLASSAVIAPIMGAPSNSARGVGRTLKSPSVIPSVWKKIGSAKTSSPISFTLVLSPADTAAFDERLEKIALDPNAPWLTEEELKAYVQPSAEAKAAVDDFIKTLSPSSVSYSSAGDKVTISTTVAQAAKALAAEFLEYKHNSTDTSSFKTHSFTIPSSISEHVTDIYPIATFGHVRQLGVKNDSKRSETEAFDLSGRAADAVPSACNTNLVTLPCIRALYGYDAYTPSPSSRTAIGIMAYIFQNYNPADLKTFLTQYRPEASGYSITVNTTDGAINLPAIPGIEASLDTQTVAGIVYPLSSTFYDIGTLFTTGDIFLLTFQHFIDTKSGRPPVITISYGSEESEFTSAQANTMCDAAKQLSSLGTTIVVSSGDSGVDGNGASSDTCPPFIPTYPAGCPYILSVGATQNFGPEVAVSTGLAGFYGGAGFSNIFSAPSYQTGALSSYKTFLGSKQSGNYNANGRGYPDISAQGSRQAVINGGTAETVGGTSASAPIVASGLALLNDILLNSGKPTTGWIHPLLYANPSALTDVTSGGSYGCGLLGLTGFAATSGWDPSTGLGTPVLSKLRTLYGV